MPDTALLAAFIAAALVVLLIPGPSVLYIITRSLGQGRRAGCCRCSASRYATGAVYIGLGVTTALSGRRQ